MNPAVKQYLDASTGHLPEGERRMLADEAEAIEADSLTRSGGMPRVIAHRWGWWVNVQHDDPDRPKDMPALCAVLDFARKHECWWINFDADAEVVDGLPVYGGHCKFCGSEHERVPEDLCEPALAEFARLSQLGRELGLEP